MYNKHTVPKGLKIKAVMFPLTPEELISTLNVLEDLHLQLDQEQETTLDNLASVLHSDPIDPAAARTAFRRVVETARFAAYPTEAVKPVHEELYKKLINLKLSLEVDNG